MHPVILNILGLLTAAGLLVSSAPAQATLQILDGGIASSMTPDGQTVVGYDSQGAWLWTASGGKTPIGGTWGADLSDDASVVIGNADDSTGIDSPAVWDSVSGWKTLGGLPGHLPGQTPLGSSWGWAHGGSSDGTVVVGRAWLVNGMTRGFRWDTVSGMVELPQSGPISSCACAVSGDGRWIGGFEELPNGAHRAILWDSNLNSSLPLIRPENPTGYGGVHAINSDGTVFVGWEAMGLGYGPIAGFRWKAGQGVVSLGPVAGTIPHLEPSVASATSEDGGVVGGSTSMPSPYLSRATLWTPATGGMILQDYLRALGVQGLDQVQLAGVTNVSADGSSIIGWGIRPPLAHSYRYVWWKATLPICNGGTAGFCSTSPNSVGGGALIGSNGHVSLAANTFELSVSGLPAETLGLFHYGPQRQQAPYGNGTLCIGAGATGLFRLPVFQADTGGNATTLVDFTHLPPAGKIRPGSTWYFQAWYRDPDAGGATFNLSDGLRATFCE